MTLFNFGSWVSDLLKARGHRYIKRIPYMSGGKRRYRYIYKVTHTHRGKRAFDEAHLVQGTAFALHTEAGAEFHGHITAVQGDQITYRIDDGERKGESVTVSKSELLSQLNDVHGIESKLNTEREKLRSQIEVAREKGSEKQVKRLEERLARLGGEQKRAEPEPPKKKRATRKKKKTATSTTYERPPKLVTPELQERHLYAQHAVNNLREYKQFLQDRGVKKRLPSDRDISLALVGYGNEDDTSVSAVQLSRSVKDLPNYRLKKTSITELPFPELHDKGIGLGVVVEDDGGFGLAFFVKRGQFAGNHYTIQSYEKGAISPMEMMVDFSRRVKKSEIGGSKSALFDSDENPLLGFLRGVDDPRDFNILNRQIVELEEISKANIDTLEYDGGRYKYPEEKRATFIEDYGEEFTERLEGRIENLGEILENGDPSAYIPTISDGDISLLEDFYNETTSSPSVTSRAGLKSTVEEVIQRAGLAGLSVYTVQDKDGIRVDIRKRGERVGGFELGFNNKYANDTYDYMHSAESWALTRQERATLARAVQRMIDNTEFKLKRPRG